MDYKITNKFGAKYGELGPKGEKCPIPQEELEEILNRLTK